MRRAAIATAAEATVPHGNRWYAARSLAQLGGTTTWHDCLVALRHLLHLRTLIRGPKLIEYERAFAERIGVRYAYSFASARVGLYGLLRSLGVGSGDEVLLHVPTHIVVANAIRYTGAKPVYVDCRKENFNIDLEQAERRITPKTKVLLLQHTFGIPVDLDAALALANRHRLNVIEDCVHALGATYGGKEVGSFGRAAIFSTEETKTISTTMGGMVVTDDSELASRMMAFQANCSWPPRLLVARYILKFALYHLLTEPHVHCYARAIYEHVGRRNPLPRPTSAQECYGKRPAGYEKRLSNAQAALGLRQLECLKNNLAYRRAIAEKCRAQLSQHGFQVPQPPAKAEPAFVRYPVMVASAGTALRAAAPHRLGTWFTSVLEESVSPIYGDYEAGSCPNAEAIVGHLVNLPTHLRVRDPDIAAIVLALASCRDVCPCARV